MNFCDLESTLLLGNHLDYVLFKLSIEFAEQGLNVWFISMKPFDKVPENIHQPEKEILQLITFIYLKDYSELVRHMNRIHQWHTVPNIIIVKDFEKYCDLYQTDYNSIKSAFLCATLIDSISCCAKKNSKSYLLVSSSVPHENEFFRSRIQVLYDMYFLKVLYRRDYKNDFDMLQVVKKETLEQIHKKT